MSVIIDGTNGLTFNDATTQSSTATNASNISSGTLGKARLPTGSVLQVVNAIYANEVSNATNTMTDTGLTASITPTSSTSKILILVSQNGCRKNNVDANNMLDLRIMRGATQISYFAGALAATSTLLENIASTSMCYLDSPATTSATTYKTQFASRNNTSAVQVQYANVSTSGITLMEISA